MDIYGATCRDWQQKGSAQDAKNDTAFLQHRVDLVILGHRVVDYTKLHGLRVAGGCRWLQSQKVLMVLKSYTVAFPKGISEYYICMYEIFCKRQRFHNAIK